jgi:hypothetical protein
MKTVSVAGLVCLCAVAIGLGGCAADAAGTEDTEQEGQQGDAIKGAQSAAAYPEAVLINMMQGGQVVAACSGALIAPRIVLTAGHCVRHMEAWQVVSPALGQSAMADAVAPYDDYENGEMVDPQSHDVGLIHLASSLTLPSYPALADEPLADGARVVNVGRIRDGQISWDHLFASKPVKVHDAGPEGYPFAYLATDKIEPGDSGGPDFVVGSGAHVIAAVNSGGGSSVELLARVDLVRSWIASFSAKHGSGAKGGSGSAGSGGGGSGGAGSGGAGGSGGSGGAGAPKACKHDVCAPGKKLDAQCDPCVNAVCKQDAYCCSGEWDTQCVVDASIVCGACGG